MNNESCRPSGDLLRLRRKDLNRILPIYRMDRIKEEKTLDLIPLNPVNHGNRFNPVQTSSLFHFSFPVFISSYVSFQQTIDDRILAVKVLCYPRKPGPWVLTLKRLFILPTKVRPFLKYPLSLTMWMLSAGLFGAVIGPIDRRNSIRDDQCCSWGCISWFHRIPG